MSLVHRTIFNYMSIETQKTLASRLRPIIERLGFQFVEDGDEEADTLILDFVRVAKPEWHFLALQFATHGRNRFILEAGKCAQDGLMLSGERLRPEQLSAGCLPVRARLQSRPGHSTRKWFRTDKFLSLFGSVPSVESGVKEVQAC